MCETDSTDCVQVLRRQHRCTLNAGVLQQYTAVFRLSENPSSLHQVQEPGSGCTWYLRPGTLRQRALPHRLDTVGATRGAAPPACGRWHLVEMASPAAGLLLACVVWEHSGSRLSSTDVLLSSASTTTQSTISCPSAEKRVDSRTGEMGAGTGPTALGDRSCAVGVVGSSASSALAPIAAASTLSVLRASADAAGSAMVGTTAWRSRRHRVTAGLRGPAGGARVGEHRST